MPVLRNDSDEISMTISCLSDLAVAGFAVVLAAAVLSLAVIPPVPSGQRALTSANPSSNTNAQEDPHSRAARPLVNNGET